MGDIDSNHRKIFQSSKLLLIWVMAPLIALSVFVAFTGTGPSMDYSNWVWRMTSSSAKMGKENDQSTLILTNDGDDGGASFNSSNSSSINEESIKKENEENANLFNTYPMTKPPITRKNYSNLERLEARLGQVRATIRKAKGDDRLTDSDFVLDGPMYWNPTAFHRSYVEMEKQLKIFIYEEGEPPMFHNGPCSFTYAIEGLFLNGMEVSPFRTRNPEEAHIFLLPISITMITQNVFVSGQWIQMKRTAKDYVDVISHKYPYWNRSLGADHLIVACHDWGPVISSYVPNLYNSSIRALCNANTSEGFDPSRDVSLPEILLPHGTTEGMMGGPPPSERSILVFFAGGGDHGPIRPVLIKHWENKDPLVQIHRYLPKNISYYGMMRKSKYCICPSGYEVASPRMVEAIYMGCVPVLIKDNYTVPFSDVLNWKTFSVIIPSENILDLKKILMSIPRDQYEIMQKRGLQLRRHFEVNTPPKRYDVFHMILHSIWLRRLNFQIRVT
ncbi:probable glycosyltransferase At5g03795 [Impatiens glandulifera]|uniref:probable glycosyltransferase At5g03795 n=1 Tax=Impatiens glandulifera TaxID=253017 RepID=UPI001FB086A7|nr:probable glycosyltransferase At5g03795 [Impatiens glandulifera]